MKDERSHNDDVAFILHPSSFILSVLEAMKGVEPLSSGLQDRRSVYPVELHRHKM